MNNVFRIISTLLMIVLVLILIWVLVNYYKEAPYSTTPPTSVNFEPVESNVIEPSENVSIPIQNNEDEHVKDETNEKTDSTDEKNDEDNTNPIATKEPASTHKDPVVITSSEQTSNSEKQEVLNEIDKALMDLLQVVDKVKPVDESRLGVDESGVQ